MLETVRDQSYASAGRKLLSAAVESFGQPGKQAMRVLAKLDDEHARLALDRHAYRVRLMVGHTSPRLVMRRP